MRGWQAGLIHLLLASPAWAGDADAGHALARRWCAGCHAVDAAVARVQDSPPSFGDIASHPGQNQSRLYAWLQAPHPAMPDLQLSRQDIDNVVTYIESLRPRP